MSAETGTILWYSVERGFGFILPDDAVGKNDRDLNVYFPSVAIATDGVKKGARVRFERHLEKTTRAARVEVVG